MSFLHKLIISIASGLVGVILISAILLLFQHKKKERSQSPESLLKNSILRVSYEMLNKAIGGFSLSNIIGTGSFGTVYKGYLDQDDVVIAVRYSTFNIKEHPRVLWQSVKP